MAYIALWVQLVLHKPYGNAYAISITWNVIEVTVPLATYSLLSITKAPPLYGHRVFSKQGKLVAFVNFMIIGRKAKKWSYPSTYTLDMTIVIGFHVRELCPLNPCMYPFLFFEIPDVPFVTKECLVYMLSILTCGLVT